MNTTPRHTAAIYVQTSPNAPAISLVCEKICAGKDYVATAKKALAKTGKTGTLTKIGSVKRTGGNDYSQWFLLTPA